VRQSKVRRSQGDASGVGYPLKSRVRDVAEFIDAVERVAAASTRTSRLPPCGTAFDPPVSSTASWPDAAARRLTISAIVSVACSR
jgi:hypothetical protein